MKIYIDSDYKCHTYNNAGIAREVDVPFFDGKCTAYIEGYRFIPSGETWTREDGATFEGEMIAPWKPWDELDAAQREYERAQLADAKAALEILGVNT